MKRILSRKKYVYILLSILSVCCIVIGCMFFSSEPNQAQAQSATITTNVAENPSNEITTYGSVDSDYISLMFEWRQSSRMIGYTDYSVSAELEMSLTLSDLQADSMYNHMVIFYGPVSNVTNLYNACYDSNGNKKAMSWAWSNPNLQYDSGTFNNAAASDFGVSWYEIPKGEADTKYFFTASYPSSSKDMAFFAYFYYCSAFSHKAYGVSDLCSFDIEQEMTNRVTDTSGLSQNNLLFAHKYFGRDYPATKTVPVQVNYFEMNDYFAYSEKSLTINMCWLYYLDTDYVWSNFLKVSSKHALSEFDCVYDEFSYLNDKVINAYQKPIRTATGYNVNIDSQTMKVTFDIVYEDFSYNDIFMCLKNNSLENQLSMFIYRTSLVETATQYNIKFNFGDIERWALSSINWNFDLEKDNLSVSGLKPHVSIVYNYEDTEHPETCTGFSVVVDKDYLNNLFGLSLVACAEITIDYDYDCKIEYKAIDSNLVATTMYSEPFVLRGSELKLWNSTDFKENQTEYMNIINNAITVKGFMEYKGIKIYWTTPAEGEATPRGSARIVIEYDYTTCIIIKNNLNSDLQYFPYTGVNSTYSLSDFGIAEYAGYRVQDFVKKENEERLIITKNDEGKIFESVLKFNCYSDSSEPIELNIIYSDLWPINITYLAPYNKNIENTPFAQQISVQKNIKVADYGDITALTTDNVAAILGIQSLNIMKSAADATPRITYNPDTQSYDVVVTYSFVSVSKLGVDGQREELKVPLTSYYDWLNLNGQDFSILWLNTLDKKYFNFSNEIDRKDLYGYFVVAVFEEKQTDLNHILRNETGEGCPVLYSGKETTGSGFYKFMSEAGLAFTSIGTTIGMAFGHPVIGAVSAAALHLGILALCEIADDNRMLYTYMFYYDGFTSAPFISTGGADNAFDKDNAMENAGQDIVDTVSDLWSDFKNSPVFQVVKWVFIGIVSIFVIGLVIRLFRWLFPPKNRR